MASLICQGILEMADLVEGGGQNSPGEAVQNLNDNISHILNQITSIVSKYSVSNPS
jgi:hypothetical protein